MEELQQRHHAAALVRQRALSSLVAESDASVRELHDVVVASLFTAEAFARQHLQLEQGKTRDYVIYNHGFADQPTSIVTVAALLPQLEQVLATGAGFLVEAGDANMDVSGRVAHVLGRVIRLAEEEALATREAQAAAEAAIAAGKVAELRVKELEMRMIKMEIELLEMKRRGEEREEKLNALEAEKQAQHVLAVEEEVEEEVKTPVRDENGDEVEAERETSPQIDGSNEKSSPPQLNEQDLSSQSSKHENIGADNREAKPNVNEDDNLVSPFAFFVKKSATNGGSSPLVHHHHHNNNNNNIDRSQSTMIVSSTAFSANQLMPRNHEVPTSAFLSNNINNNMRSHSAMDSHQYNKNSNTNSNQHRNQNNNSNFNEDDPANYDTYIVNNRPFIAPRWAAATNANNNTINAAANAVAHHHLPPQVLQHTQNNNTNGSRFAARPLYEPPSKALERQTEILSVIGNHTFSPQDLDWGRSVSAQNVYRRDDEDKLWNEHAPYPKQQQKFQDDIANPYDDNNNGEADNGDDDAKQPQQSPSTVGVMTSNPWLSRSISNPVHQHQQFNQDPQGHIRTREYYSPEPAKLNDAEKVPPQFVHPADLLKFTTQSTMSQQEQELAKRNNNNNNNNNAFVDNSSEYSRQFLMSDHMRNGEAQAIISVASGVATKAEDYAIDTTLDWLKRMTHGPMLQLEQTLLQRDFSQKIRSGVLLGIHQENSASPYRGSEIQQQNSITNNNSPAGATAVPGGKPPLANPTLTQNQQADASLSPPSSPPIATKKAPGKFALLTKKIISNNRANNASATATAKAPSSPPATPKSNGKKAPAAPIAAAVGVKGRQQLPRRGSLISSNNGNSKAPSQERPDQDQQQDQQQLPAVPLLSTQNLQLHTQTLTGGKELPGARHDVDPYARPPEPGQIVETEDEILEHLEKDSNYAEKQLQKLAGKKDGGDDLGAGVVAVAGGSAPNSSNETSSLRQIHHLLGGTQPSMHRDAGGSRLEPEQVEDTTPAPFRRRKEADAYDVKPHGNTQSEDRYFQSANGVLHALHRVLQQETKERREKEAAAAVAAANGNNNTTTATNNRSASGTTSGYFGEY